MTPKHHTFTLGKMQCTVLLDGTVIVGLERIMRAFPEASEAEYRQVYADMGLSLDEADFSANVLLVKTDTETVLIDTGEAGTPRGGLLPESMKQAHIDPASITMVILTHSHGDHVQGLLSEDDKPAFPNASYVISKTEMAFWQDCIEKGIVDHRPIVDMLESQNVRVIDMDEEITRGIRAIPLQGHTPGQIGVLLESEGERLIHLADLLHLRMQFPHPEWSASADHDSNISVPTRRKWLRHSADENLMTFFFHLTFPGMGYVHHTDETFLWKPK